MANIGTYAISDVGNELSGIMHGTSLNQINDLYGAYNRAARRVLQDVDPQETKVVKQFGQVWDGVFDYAIDGDVKGNKIIDLAPQANRQLVDNFGQSYNKEFDLWKNFSLVPDFSLKYSNGVRTIRINATNLFTGIQINAADGVSTNGTWVAGANVSNVQSDNQYYTDGAAGSVSFQIGTGANPSTAIISNSTFSAVDLSTHYNNSYIFFLVYLPNASGITSVQLQFGSSSGNYYQLPVMTTDYMGNPFVNGWNLCGASWSTATTVGAPVNTSIGFLKASIVYSGTIQTQVRINQFYSRLGVIFNYEYYSKFLFRDGVTNAFKEKVTADSDIINLDTDGFNLFLYASALEAIEQQQGLAALFGDQNNLQSKYSDTLAEYQSKYKSEITKPRSFYYRQPGRGYRRYIGRGGYRIG